VVSPCGLFSQTGGCGALLANTPDDAPIWLIVVRDCHAAKSYVTGWSTGPPDRDGFLGSTVRVPPDLQHQKKHEIATEDRRKGSKAMNHKSLRSVPEMGEFRGDRQKTMSDSSKVQKIKQDIDTQHQAKEGLTKVCKHSQKTRSGGDMQKIYTK
jgi:hypothetical protein